MDDLSIKFGDALRELRAQYLEGIGEDIVLDERGRWPWLIGFSAGKDSTLVLQVVIEMLLDIAPSRRLRPIHVIAGDTLVESPVFAAYVTKQLDRLADAMPALRLPVDVVRTVPAYDQTFWVNLIGRGYPAPNRVFRWCTDRLKIRPAGAVMKEKIAAAGRVILLLGVRRAESAARAASAARFDAQSEGRLNPHSSIAGCWVMRPILEFTTDEVWTTLLQRRPPWGGTHRDLVTLYRNAQGGECPFVVDQNDAPSCGTGSARFGCWTCTVVKKDKSLAGLIDAGFEHLEPLAEFRDWLRDFSEDVANRSPERRDLGDGIGGLTLAARAVVLERLLETQTAVGVELITRQEIEQIETEWRWDPSVRVLAGAKKMLRLLKDTRRCSG